MKPHVGFLGLGAMGKPMATRLVQAGYEVTTSVHRNRAVVDELVELGAGQAANPAAVAERADVIITMLPDSPQVEEVCFGCGGIVEGKRAGRPLVVIDMSTVSPLATRTLAARLREAGITLLDAPVSGGVWRAESGELTIMVGGELEQVEQQRELLSVMGSRVIHVGPVGSGEIVKITNNVLAALILPALSEALTMGVKAGVPLATLRKVIATSSGNNYLLQHWLPKTLFQDNFEDGFALELLRKDIGLALEVGRELNVPMLETGLAYQIFTQAVGQGYGDQDMTAVSKIYQQAANIHLLSGEAYHDHPSVSV